MDAYRSDEQQLEALKKWWQENGKALAAGAVLGLGGLVGWQSWQTHQARQAEAASQAYQQVMAYTESRDNELARAAARTVLDQHAGSVYGSLAAFTLAKLAVQDGDLDEARSHLRWVLDQGSEDKLRHIARLRLARLALDDQDLDAAWNTLHEGPDLAHLSTFHELRGDILAQRGDAQAAREAYQLALRIRNQVTPEDEAQTLRYKIDDLGSKENADG